MKKVLFIFFFSTFYPLEIYSQWTVEDSLWLEDMLSGHKELRLKPEVIEAIRLGKFLDIDKQNPENELRNIPLQLPLLKDFSPYMQVPDSNLSKMDYTQIPPSVFMLYGNNPVKPLNLRSFSLEGIENYELRYSPPLVITDPLKKGQASGGAVCTVSINDILEFVFRKIKGD